jgi:hypothetical protein
LGRINVSEWIVGDDDVSILQGVIPLRGRNGVEIVRCGAADEAIKGDRRLFLRDKHQGSNTLQGISIRRTSIDDTYVCGIGMVDGGRVINPIERQGVCGISTGLGGTSLGVKNEPVFTV